MFEGLLKQPFWRLEPASRTAYNKIAPSGWKDRIHCDCKEGLPSEAVVVSPDSYVVPTIGERIRLKDLKGDERFTRHMTELSFIVRRGDTGSWTNPMFELRKGMKAFLEVAEQVPPLLRAVNVDMVKGVIEGGSHLETYRRAVELLNGVVPAIECEPALIEHDAVIERVQDLRNILEPMSRTMPPIRANVQKEKGDDAKAALIVTGTEAGAELYLGLKGPIGQHADLWSRIVKGPKNIHPFLNITGAKVGMYGIPENAPFGMSGGVKYVSIAPSDAKTVCLDEWHRCVQDSLWSRIDSLVASRVGMLGSVKPSKFQAADGDARGAASLFRPLAPHASPEYKGHLIETPSFQASWIAKQEPVKEAHRIFAQGSPVALVMMYGAMTVKHPEGPEVAFTEGEACLFPANTNDLFGFAVVEAPAAYLMITNALPSVSPASAFLQGMMGMPVR